MPALPLSLPVSLNIVDDEEWDMNSECDSEKEDTNISDYDLNDNSTPTSNNDNYS